MNTGYQWWSRRLHHVADPCRNEEGSAAVELGATMLLFLTALFAVAEFGWYFLHQNTLTQIAR